jgi:hypothetical protein
VLGAALEADRVQVYINGNLVSATFPPWAAASVATTDVTAFGIGAGGAGVNPLTGSIGFIWIDGLSYITDPTKFYDRGVIDLGASGDKPNGVRPGIYFGCDQSVAGWNAGTNRGDLGTFTVSGTIT